jgi:glutaryl-CoA dehydrogenase
VRRVARPPSAERTHGANLSTRNVIDRAGAPNEFPVIRHINNLGSVLTFEGTAEMHTMVVGQALTGLSAFG